MQSDNITIVKQITLPHPFGVHSSVNFAHRCERAGSGRGDILKSMKYAKFLTHGTVQPYGRFNFGKHGCDKRDPAAFTS